MLNFSTILDQGRNDSDGIHVLVYAGENSCHIIFMQLCTITKFSFEILYCSFVKLVKIETRN
jgi:hypothetical protein